MKELGSLRVYFCDGFLMVICVLNGKEIAIGYYDAREAVICDSDDEIFAISASDLSDIAHKYFNSISTV